MSGAKHTPGPWDYCGPSKPMPDAPEGGDYAIKDGGTNIIAEAYFRTGPSATHNALANARLIAAAPEMLDELQKAHALLILALKHMTQMGQARFAEESERRGLGVDGATRHHERAAVIAKATGSAA